MFTKAGFDVTIASIAGGAVPIDAGSLAEPFFAPDAKAFMHDAKAFGALSHSVKVEHGVQITGRPNVLKQLLRTGRRVDGGPVRRGLFVRRPRDVRVLCGNRVA